MAFYKSQVAAGYTLPLEGSALITVAPVDRKGALSIAKELSLMGFKIIATEGTADFLRENMIDCEYVKKLQEGRPNIVDLMKNRIPYFTITDASCAAAKGIRAARENRIEVKSLQEYHKALRVGCRAQ